MSKFPSPIAIFSHTSPVSPAIVQKCSQLNIEILSLVLASPEITSHQNQIYDEIFREIAIYESAFFENALAVECFFDQFFERFPDIRAIGPMRFMTTNPTAKKAIEDHHLSVEVFNESFDQLIIDLENIQSLENQKILVIGDFLNMQPIVSTFSSKFLAIVDMFPVHSIQPSSKKYSTDFERFKSSGAQYFLFSDEASVDIFIQKLTLFFNPTHTTRPKVLSLNSSISKKLKSCSIPIYKELNLDSIEAFPNVAIDLINS